MGCHLWGRTESAMTEATYTPFAIEVGFHHIDCAHVYQNEEEIGQVIRSKIADGTVPEHLKCGCLKYGVLYMYTEKTMAPHSSTLAWRIPGTGEPGGLPSMGSHRVSHD